MRGEHGWVVAGLKGPGKPPQFIHSFCITVVTPFHSDPSGRAQPAERDKEVMS